MQNLLIVFLSLILNFHLQAQPQIAAALPVAAVTSTENLVWNETTHDFGQTPINQAVTTTFEVTNHSDEVLIIKSVKASCGCTTPEYSEGPVLPGATSFITAKYNAKKPGKYNKTIKVLTNQSEAPIILSLKGEILE